MQHVMRCDSSSVAETDLRPYRRSALASAANMTVVRRATSAPLKKLVADREVDNSLRSLSTSTAEMPVRTGVHPYECNAGDPSACKEVSGCHG
ncbi:hypothetical protein Y032_0435g1408 [Ancylostoma ceylanicum]|uniref:Uncharacterized protein n=1 Tax=Ancylostoma ceylanicum TaxID=53326 RepID=A0A016X044_9BILA|nr:hypothetical protein Y032_0435g1408 [Ancylostoma ceylanicum]